MSGSLIFLGLVESQPRQGVSVVLVTHDARVAACAGRRVMVRDGVGTVDAVAVRA